MVGKLRFYGLLAISVVVCGCAGEQEPIDSNTKNAEPEVKTAKSEKTMVKLETSRGDIIIELDKAAAPITVKNFLAYVEGGFYDGTIFHRVIADFMIQSGGLTPQMSQKPTHSAIVNEASNGLKNERGAIAMGQSPGNPNSATSHFFINHKHNVHLDYVEGRNPGYAVFGKVVEGMDVVDAVAAVKTTVRMGMPNVPVEPVVIKSAKVVFE